jgi:hypothetical protein
MIAAVNDESDRLERIRDRVLAGNKRSNPFTADVAVRPRLETSPGQQPPGPPGRIPASSQKPDRKTNVTIPYSRMTFTDFPGSMIPTDEIVPGNVLFVYKGRAAVGSNTNKPTKCASLDQVNSMLSGPPQVGFNVLGGGMQSNVLAARRRFVEDMLKLFQVAQLDEEQKVPRLPDGKEKEQTEIKIDMYRNLIEYYRGKDGKAELESDPFIAEFDWRAVDVLENWSPDGVLMSRDDNEYDSDWFKAGHDDSGVLLNVCVGGPALTANASALCFDSHPQPLDSFYLLLVCNDVRNSENKLLHRSFQFKRTSGRILAEMAKRNPTAMPSDTVPPLPGALSFGEFRRCCALWRLGRVMDSHPTSSQSVTLHVAIRELDIFEMDRLMDGGLGTAIQGTPKQSLSQAMSRSSP